MPKAPPFLYRFLSVGLFIIWVLHAIFHALKFKQASYFLQRFGFSSGKIQGAKIWVHMASVGEVKLMQPLCIELLNKGHSLLLTTTTATGKSTAFSIFGHNSPFKDQVEIATLPIDFLPFSLLFSKVHSIKLALIAETELWPETLYHIAKKNIPILHINARLSPKSLHAHSLIQSTLKSTLAYFSHHFVRFESDIAHFKQMHVNPEKISVMDNLKYGHIKQNESSEFENLIHQDYVLFASSHEDEELMLAQLKKDNPHWPLLVIAPRHPKRAQVILNQLKNLKLTIAQRSHGDDITSSTDIYLADTLGELSALMSHAQIVIMGGSFVDIGGHNIIEPAALGCCIITGPSDRNIKPDVEALTQANAMIQVESIQHLSDKVNKLLGSEQALTMKNNAKQFVATKGEILERYMKELSVYL